MLTQGSVWDVGSGLDHSWVLEAFALVLWAWVAHEQSSLEVSLVMSAHTHTVRGPFPAASALWDSTHTFHFSRFFFRVPLVTKSGFFQVLACCSIMHSCASEIAFGTKAAKAKRRSNTGFSHTLWTKKGSISLVVWSERIFFWGCRCPNPHRKSN